MTPTESPFPCFWWGTSLDNVGLAEQRPRWGTYGRYDFDRLPVLPFELRGDFHWLLESEPAAGIVRDENSEENAETFRALYQVCNEQQLQLPAEFVRFSEDQYLHRRVRSSTDCYLDFTKAPTRSPVGDGYLIRFLADSQGCLFWYLFLNGKGPDHAVVATPGLYGPEDELWEFEEEDPAEIVYCAETFEEFMCRFWLENEMWFSEYEQTPMPEAGKIYLERYLRGRS